MGALGEREGTVSAIKPNYTLILFLGCKKRYYLILKDLATTTAADDVETYLALILFILADYPIHIEAICSKDVSNLNLKILPVKISIK